MKSRRVFPPLVVLGLLLGLWWSLARWGPWPSYLFPSPEGVAGSLVHLGQTGRIWPSLWATVQRLLLGFGISLVVGTLLAFALVRFKWLRRGVQPYLLGLQSLPGIAWVPFAILWFGFGEAALVFVTVAGSLFAVTIAFTDALALVPPHLLWAARTMGSKGMHLIVRVALPAAFPNLVSGAKQCWAFAWRSLVGAEIIFATVGLGFLLNQGREFFDAAQVLAIMLCTLAVGALVEVLLFSKLEKRLKRRWGLAAG